MVTDIEELEETDASEIHATRLNESVNAHEKWTIHIPNRGWNSKTLWRDQDLRTSTLIRDSPERGEEQDTISAEMITEMRGADLIVFEINFFVTFVSALSVRVM